MISGFLSIAILFLFFFKKNKKLLLFYYSEIEFAKMRRLLGHIVMKAIRKQSQALKP